MLRSANRSKLLFMGQVIHIDDFKHGHSRANLHKCSIPEQYKIIGETLTISEVASMRSGVPWLPPSNQRRKLNQQYSQPLNHFLKLSLKPIFNEIGFAF